ncbi:uncharacterized protein RJT20DRAFT_48641 [Scheffersomyces xylosifermentans]|uniref:uncharacterized protein n=1 Tax=Scheffersomyces xylosifermentans TaxID=1304137 RepID=UPI00315CD62F
MSFSFGFTKEDLSDDEIEESNVGSSGQMCNAEGVSQSLIAFSERIEEAHLPKIHTIESLLSTLRNVRLTFDNYTTPIGKNVIYRRELFDVKHQVMTEDDEENAKVNEILINTNNNDLEKRVYEGGFKSWECSYDTVDKLSNLLKPKSDSILTNYSSFLDFGCGTSLPTSYLIMEKFQSKNKRPSTFILSDYNYDVLRLVSLPNIIIHWASTVDPEKLHNITTNEDIPAQQNDELLLTDRLLEEFLIDLKEYNINLVFISGSWGTQFNDLIEPLNVDFIITSETIYSLETLPVVAGSIISILSKSKANEGHALIAAKNIYFGVGGSVVEFLNYFNKVKSGNFIVNVEEVNDASLKRSIIGIVYKS